MQWVKNIETIQIYKRYRSCLTALFLIIILLAIMEAIFFFKFKKEYGHLGYSIKDLSKGRVQDSPYTVYEPVSNILNLKAKFRQNNYGFRNENDVLVKEQNEFRIFILGGSAAYGEGSTPQVIKITGIYQYPSMFTIAACLERKLSKIYPTKKIKVFNAAVPGFSISQEYAFYMSTIRKLEPDLLILIDGFNDMCFPLDDPTYYRADHDKEKWKMHPHKTSLLYVAAKYLMPKSYTLFYLGRFVFVYRYRYDKKFYEKWLKEDVKVNKEDINATLMKYRENISFVIEDIIKRYEIFKETCRIDGVHIVYCPQPLLTLKPRKDNVEIACYNYLLNLLHTPGEHLAYFDMYELFLNIFEHWAKKENVSYINLQREVNKIEEKIFIDHCHFSFYGNEYIAGLLKDKIKEMGIIE